MLILVDVFLGQFEYIFVVFVSLAWILSPFCVCRPLYHLTGRTQQSVMSLFLLYDSLVLRDEDIFDFFKRQLIHMLSEKFGESKRLQLKQLSIVY